MKYRDSGAEPEEILQITLTPEESKRFIAEGLLRHRKVMRARERGAILFKGGSTVSAASCRICGEPTRICGLITEKGTKTNLSEEGAHVLLYRENAAAGGVRIEWLDEDEAFRRGCRSLGRDDLVICGANAIDAFGNAAMMTGSAFGGDVPAALADWDSEGIHILVPVGCEKLIPGRLPEIVRRTGRLHKTMSFGMAVGLVLVPGEVFTEVEAAELLADVEAVVIGAGGLGTAQGSVVLDIRGTEEEVEKIYSVVKHIKCSTIKGEYEVRECGFPNPNCGAHFTCVYKGMEW